MPENTDLYPATPEEYAEYEAFMESEADRVEREVADPEPAEDRYLDSYWEDAAEIGFGDF